MDEKKEEKPKTRNFIANDNQTIEIGIINAIISSINHKMYGFPPLQFNQNLENDEYHEYFQMCNDWIDYMKENHKQQATFSLSNAIDKFTIFYRKRRSKRNISTTPKLNESVNLKNKISSFYNIWNVEFFHEKLKIILSLCQSLYIIQNLVDDLWKFSGGAHIAKENENKLLEQKMLKKRAKVVKEIYQTEEVYTNDIEILVNSFMNPLKNNKIIKSIDVYGIFANIKDILKIHQELCNKLYQRFEDTKLLCMKMQKTNEIETAIEEKPETKEEGAEGEEKKEEDEKETLEDLTFQHIVIGDLFEEMASELKIYVEYCNNYNVSSKLTEELKFRDQNYNNFVTTCAIPFKKSLESYLILPVQRVYRYELLLDRVVKSTPDSHRDKELIARAINEMHNTAVFLDKNQKKMSKFRMKQLFQKKQEKYRVSTLKSVNPTNYTKTRTKASESGIDEQMILPRNSSTLRGMKKKMAQEAKLTRSISLPADLLVYFFNLEKSQELKKEVSKEEVIDSLRKPLSTKRKKTSSLQSDDFQGENVSFDDTAIDVKTPTKLKIKVDSPSPQMDQSFEVSPISQDTLPKLEDVEIQPVDNKKDKLKNRSKLLSIGNVAKYRGSPTLLTKEISKDYVEKMKEEISMLPIDKVIKNSSPRVNKSPPPSNIPTVPTTPTTGSPVSNSPPSTPPPSTPTASPPMSRKDPTLHINLSSSAKVPLTNNFVSPQPLSSSSKVPLSTSPKGNSPKGKVDWSTFWNGKKTTGIASPKRNKDDDDEEDDDEDDHFVRKRSFSQSPYDSKKKSSNKDTDPLMENVEENGSKKQKTNIKKFDFSSILSKSPKTSPKHSPKSSPPKNKENGQEETSDSTTKSTPRSLKDCNEIISPRVSREFKKSDIITQMNGMLQAKFGIEKLKKKEEATKTKKEESPKKQSSKTVKPKKTKEITHDSPSDTNAKKRTSISIIDSGDYILKTKQSKEDIELLFLTTKNEKSSFPGVDVKTMRKKNIPKSKFLEYTKELNDKYNQEKNNENNKGKEDKEEENEDNDNQEK